MQRIRASMLVIVLAVTSLLSIAPQASAASGSTVAAVPPYPYEDDLAVVAGGSPPSGAICSGPYGGRYGCFQKYGDYWWILDHAGDGFQTYVYWENELWDGVRWRAYRNGECNNNLGAGNWGRCNKDYYEDSSTNYFGKKGSRIRFQFCIRVPVLPDECTPYYIDEATWYRNNA